MSGDHPPVQTSSTSSTRRRAAFLPTLVTGIVLAVQAATAVDVKVTFEKTFDFKRVQTWGWHPDGAVDVKMARSADDDPEAMKRAAEPVIVSAVTTEMERRQLQFRASNPDLYLKHYLLLTTSINTQEMGQFLPATTAWGLPPFAPATQSLEVMAHGSLVLDVSVGQAVVIWRGVARSKLKFGERSDRREALLREAVRDLLKKLPGPS
jgi:hypothetical protein